MIERASHSPPEGNGRSGLTRAAQLMFSSAQSSSASTPVTISPTVVMHAISRSLRWSLPAALGLAVTAGLLIWFLCPPQYRAAAWLKIEDRKPVLAFPTADSPLFVKTQIELFRNPLVLDRALSQPGVANLPEVRIEKWPAQWLARKLSVKSVGGSELFEIGFVGPDAESGSQIVNAVLDSYLKVQWELTDTITKGTIENLKEEKRLRELDLQRLRENLKNLAKETSGRDPSLVKNGKELAIIGGSPLVALQDRLTSAEVEREVLEAQHKALEQSLAQQQVRTPALSMHKAIEEDLGVKRLKDEIAEIRAKIQETELAAAGGKDDPASLRLHVRLKQSQEALSALRRDLAGSAAADIEDSVRAAQQTELDQLMARIATQRAMEALLTNRLAEQRKEMESLGDRSLEVEFTRSELERAENVYNRIADRIVELQTELRAPARITPLALASAAKAAPERDASKPLIFGILFAVCLPFAVAVAWELRTGHIGAAQQISDASTLPVIGEVTQMPSSAMLVGPRETTRYHRLRGMFEESIDQLRNRLILPDSLKDLRVVAVTSAISGEGKTSLASQLAVSLARTSPGPVLLIDADFRAPEIHTVFDVPLAPGLTEVLQGKSPMQAARSVQWGELVHLLPAGRSAKDHDLLLTSENLSRLLKDARARYRYIVIDCPPLLSASEALVVAKASDGTILCTMRGTSRRAQVSAACERLLAAGARPLGVVLNGVPLRQYSYYYGMYDRVSNGV